MFDRYFGDFPSFMVAEFLLSLCPELSVAYKGNGLRIGTALAVFFLVQMDRYKLF